MKFIIHPDYLSQKETVLKHIQNFDTEGELFTKGSRNVIKLFKLGTGDMNVKSFKVPNLINKVVYKFFRKSKAERSYLYAVKLLENGIGTPKPIAYAEESSMLGLRHSYYVSEHLITELTFRELVDIPNYPDAENILRQFTQFCFKLHEKGIEFLDHSPGNTLIKKKEDGLYDFYLVDLNRMNFHNSMDFNLRMENLKRLTPKKEMIAIISNEYAKHYSKSESEIFESLWYKTSEFQRKFWRKRALKKKLKFKKHNL